MNVTRTNFEEALTLFKSLLQNSAFVSLDLEFTGVSTGSTSPLDTLQDRYASTRSVAMAYLPIQIGICLFSLNTSKKIGKLGWTAQSFNFYLMKKEGRFQCQGSSIEFLASCNFDFNKAFREGVPYLTYAEEERQRERLKLKSESTIPIDHSNEEFVSETVRLVEEWLQNGPEKALELRATNAYQRKLVHQEVFKRFGEFLYTESGNHSVVITKLTVEEREVKTKKKTEELEKDVFNSIGFRHVVDSLIEVKKPVVGHNMFLDLQFVLHHFCGCLPESVEEFKKEALERFPVMIDTKHIILTNAELCKVFHSSALSDAYKVVISKDFASRVALSVKMAKGFQSYSLQDNAFHDAGFDALCTGVLFVRSLAYIEKTHEDVEFVNKLHLMRSDILFVDMLNHQVTPDRSNAYRIHSYPSDWKTAHIQNHIRQKGYKAQVYWVDNNCVALFENYDGSQVLDFAMEPYAEWKKKRVMEGNEAEPKRIKN